MTAKLWRRISQVFFVSFMAFVGIKHQIVGGGPQGAPPIDSYCVFGGVETLFTWLKSGEFLLKTNTSNLILFLAVLAITILMGAVFCGWICPLGAIQEWLGILGRKIFGKQIEVPKKLETPLRSLKYIFLITVVAMTIRTGKLWFEVYDPFKVFFHFEFEGMLPYIILISFSILALLIERFWCKYLCPLGAIIFPLSYFGIINLNRDDDSCNDCNLCNHSCSMDLTPNSSISETECIKCLDCIDNCPQPDTLYLSLNNKEVK